MTSKSASLTAGQRKALQHCAEHGKLLRTRDNLWRWLAKTSQGFLFKAASNPSIVILLERGFLKRTSEREVEITPAGRAALKGTPR